MWLLKESLPDRVVYQNDITGGTTSLSKVYTDREGNSWWQFDDLISIPHTRNFAATKISQLYNLGLTKIDLTTHIDAMKAILKSNDKEKFEKAYANILDFEAKVANATGSTDQMSALVCVYFIMNDEPIDSFVDSIQARKMSILAADPAMHAFFLNRLTVSIEHYTAHLGAISQIALSQMADE